MNKNNCPGCGALWNGRRCRSCGYEPFREEPRRRSSPSPKSKKTRRKYPFLGFLLLLALIWTILPLLKKWGMELEVMEEINRSVTQEAVVPDAELLTLYYGENLHIFTTKYDAEHLSDGLTLYIQNSSDRDLVLHTDGLLINGSTAGQQLYCKAYANVIGTNLLRFVPETGASEIQSVSFRLKAFDIAGNQLFTSDRIALGEDAQTEESYF